MSDPHGVLKIVYRAADDWGVREVQKSLKELWFGLYEIYIVERYSVQLGH